MVCMRFTFVACFASKVGDIGMVGVEFQILEFFVALYLKPYVKAIISTTPTSLFSLPWLHQFTIVGIPHGNWRMVAIPGFFIRIWERSSVLERCRSSQQIQEKADDTRKCEYGLSEVVLRTWSLTKLFPPFPCHRFNYSIPQTDRFSNDF